MRNRPFFSIVMPVCLKPYKNAASNREEKLVRAVDSVLAQSFTDYELVIIADGCDKTTTIIRDNYYGERKIRLFRISDDRNFGGKRDAGHSSVPRNAGIQEARGEYIIYLDGDDVYVEGYLQELYDAMGDKDWYWFDNLSWNADNNRFDRYVANIDVQGRCGTSSICHRRKLGVFWNEKGTYLHDWIFINILKAVSQDYERLDVAGYGVLHVPHLLNA